MVRLFRGVTMLSLACSLALPCEAIAADDAVISSALTIEDHDADVWSACYSTDGSRILTASADHTARVWAVRRSNILATFEHGLFGVAYSPDGHQLVTASHDHTAQLWEVSCGR